MDDMDSNPLPNTRERWSHLGRAWPALPLWAATRWGEKTWWVGLVTKNGKGKPMLKKFLEELLNGLNGHKIIVKPWL